MATFHDCAGVILAGGRSSRMGAPKAWLEFGGEPMLARIAWRLAAELPELVVVRAAGQELPAVAARMVDDRVEGEGPVAGLAVGLGAVTRALAFVVSCDVPFVSMAVARGLLGLADEYDVVVPRWEGRLHPLQAVYRASLAPLLEEQLAAGRRRPVDLFDRVRTRFVDEKELRAWDPEGRTFVNMNTPEEYEAARAMGEGP
jgi:molybdopterin-guanine dinucleotide biosynthesis protein A